LGPDNRPSGRDLNPGSGSAIHSATKFGQFSEMRTSAFPTVLKLAKTLLRSGFPSAKCVESKLSGLAEVAVLTLPIAYHALGLADAAVGSGSRFSPQRPT
jgi:hypothetical protein